MLGALSCAPRAAQGQQPLPQPADAPLTEPIVYPVEPVATPNPPNAVAPAVAASPMPQAGKGELASATLPIEAGRTPGAFTVTNSGAGTYSIALWAPPGIGSLQLKLSLVYSSRAPNDTMGPGWTIGGLSTITRCNKSWIQDGAPAAVTNTLSDRFCLDGQQLKLVSGSYGQTGSVYATEVESFSKIVASGSIGNGPESFTVTSKNGLVYSYGTTSSSQILAGTSGTIRTWALSQIADRVGNTVNFTYTNDTTNGSYRVQEIDYPTTSTGQGPFYRVQFAYAARPVTDIPSGYLAGYETKEPYELSTITMQWLNGGSWATIKTYNLSYEPNAVSSRIQLTSVQECSASNCLPSTAITYQSGAQGWSSTIDSTGVSSSGAVAPIPLDLNGDGRTDILYPVAASGSTSHWWATLSTGTGFSSPIDTHIVTNNTDTIIGGAFSGLQQQQFLAPQSGTWFIVSYNGTSFTSVSTQIPVNGEFEAVDWDGDGLPDLVSVVGSNVDVRRNVTAPPGAVTFSSSVDTVWTFTGTRVQFQTFAGLLAAADFNGDGRADVLIATYTETKAGPTYWNVLLSNGFGSSASVTTLSAPPYPAVPIAVDWNGDGCSDIASSGGIFLSNCAGGFTSIARNAGSIYDLVLAVDWDGDGRTDLVYNASTINGYAGEWSVQRSTGDGIAAPVSTGIAAPAGTAWFAIDADGDGLADLAFVNGNSGNSINYELHEGNGTPPDLATSFTDGFGMNQSPTYIAINKNNYSKYTSAVFPEQDYNGPLYVVNQFTGSDGTGSTFQQQFWYYGGKIHLQGRGFEGFYAQRTYDTRNTLYTYEYLGTQFPWIGMFYQRTTLQSNLSTDVELYAATLANQVSGGAGYEQRKFPYLSSSTDKQYEVGGALNGTQTKLTAITYTYGDGYGNPTEIQTSITDTDPGSPFLNSTWELVNSTTFENDASANWCLGLPTTNSVESVVPSETAQTRAASYSVDSPHCRVTQQIIEPAPAAQALMTTTTLTYDPSGCGNVTEVDVVGHNFDGSTLPTRTTKYGYGTRCQLAEKITNALAQATNITYRYDFGLPTQAKDPNNIAINWLYDDFGRKSQETRPDATYSTFSYSYCSTPPCWGVSDLRFLRYQYDYDSGGTYINTHELFYDGFDRLRYNESYRIFGTWTDNRINLYDSLGRTTARYNPKSSASNGDWTFTYDVLNRIMGASLYQSTGTLDRSVGFQYAGRTTTITDPLNNKEKEVKDVLGLLREVTDPSPGGTTYYNYDAFGNLNSTKDANGIISTATYNLRGFKTQSVDADRGTWNFNGDSLKEIVSYTDAKQHSFGVTYDVLGRMTSRSEPEGTSTWTWGSTPSLYNIGKLQSVAGNGYSETRTYDSVGRLLDRAITTDTTYNYDYTYNSIGAIDTITYPTSPAPTGTTATRYKIDYSYSVGAPYMLRDITQTTPSTLWTLASVNDYSAATSETLGASLISRTSGYKAWTDELVSVASGVTGSSNNRQNLAYTWDNDDNLTERQDLLYGQSETFVPDALNRLKSATVTGGTALTVGYDGAGDITSRSDVGSYTYGDSAHPHAVTAAGSSTYTYDANGNVATRDGLSLTWSSFNLPTFLQASVNGSTLTSTFVYGPQHQRYEQIGTFLNGTETTYYVADLLEKKLASTTGVTYYRHFIPTPYGITVIVSRNSDASTSMAYVLSDHLGSSDAVLDNTGALLVQESFGPFGARRGSTWTQPAPTYWDSVNIAATTRRGFTFQEMLDNLGLIHMNGRVYDPAVARFLSVDPIIGDLTDTQSVNPYAYAGNRPLNVTDPTGLDPDDTIVVTGSPGSDGGLLGEIENFFQDLFEDLFGGGGAPPPPPASALPGISGQGPAPQCTGGAVSPACGISVNQLEQIVVTAGGGHYYGFSVFVNGQLGTYFILCCESVNWASNTETVPQVTVTGHGVWVWQESTDLKFPVESVDKYFAAALLGGAPLLRAGAAAVESTAGATEVATGTASTAARGTTVYRVFGGNAKPFGQFWTTTNPLSVENFRIAAGIFPENTGEFFAEGTLTDTEGVTFSPAAPGPGGVGGGLPQVEIPDPVTQICLVCVYEVTPPF
jgi:RHS repeat-associated protein